MEIHIVLPHELIEVNVLGVEPPLFPLRGEIRGYAKITYRGIKLCAIRWCVIVTRRSDLTQTSGENSLSHGNQLT